MMSKLRFTQFYLSVCTLAIIATLINLDMSSDSLIIVLALAVIFLGLPHGALDFAVAKSMNFVPSIPLAIRFIAVYMGIAALSIIFWVYMPEAALVIFLSISVFHFSADWRLSLPFFSRLGLASSLICGPSVFHSSTVTDLFNALLVTAEAANWIVQGMRLTFYIGTLFFLNYVIRSLFRKKSPDVWQYIEWLAIIFSSLILSPLIHFGLYFCLLHSPKHLQDVGVELGVSIKRAVIISLPFVILTIILGAVMYEFFGSDKLSNDLMRWIFIGLFGLTVSHMALIHLWHGSD
jgi:Brp/Blh family beta-carotene 15,15'-monooxygenase